MQPEKMDVLIAGAGPAGMTLAAALQRQNVRFRIVDREAGPTEATRAPVLWQRTQEILAALGLRTLWEPFSEEMRAQSLHFYGRPAGEVAALAPNSPYPKALFNGQNVTDSGVGLHEKTTALGRRLPRWTSATQVGRESPGSLGEAAAGLHPGESSRSL